MTQEFKALCEAFEALASKLDSRLSSMEARMSITDGKPIEVEKEIDLTRRELPLPEWCPPLPDLPEGKSRWVCRGTFSDRFNDPCIYGDDREIRYVFEGSVKKGWRPTCSFGTSAVHIEAV